jgi:hypothetical protein
MVPHRNMDQLEAVRVEYAGSQPQFTSPRNIALARQKQIRGAVSLGHPTEESA